MIRPERGARVPNRPLAERNGAGRGRVGWRFSPSHPSDSIPLYSFPQKGKSMYVPSMAPAALPSPFFFMSGKTKWPAKASERGRSQTVRGKDRLEMVCLFLMIFENFWVVKIWISSLLRHDLMYLVIKKALKDLRALLILCSFSALTPFQGC